MNGLLFYFVIIFFSCAMLCFAQKTKLSLQGIYVEKRFSSNQFVLFIFLVSPILFIYTIRYGIGTDYFAYRSIFELLHYTNFEKYWHLHNLNYGSYYVEPGFYILNRFLSFNFISLLFVCSLLIFGFVYFGAIKLVPEISMAWCIFIYYCTQFIFSMNVMRFAIAITIVFLSIYFIMQKKFVLWCLFVVLASWFHKTSIICFPLYFLVDINNKKLSKVRNFLWYVFVFGFPIIAKMLFMLAASISLFSRYFATAKYMLGGFTFKPMFLFHIAPVLLPILIVKRKFVFQDRKAALFFRVLLLEIPMRELGAFNTWLSRLARFPQMIQIVFIPYVLSSIKNQKLKIILKVYYVAWYSFYFIYGALVNDMGDSVPYRSILFM
ncbi:MAG: EpsG family protein [Treponema sp.]|nr:EpsG family protein [Treponema sp.]